MPGMDKVLKGIINYNKTLRPQMAEKFKKLRDHPSPPRAVLFSCMDSRVLVTRMIQADIGGMFVLRNAGNLIPHAKLINSESVSTEPGALEFGVLHNGVQNIYVCGHSDCKAMRALFDMTDTPSSSPLDMWLRRHAASTRTMFEQLTTHGNSKPLTFGAGANGKELKAYIDPDNEFAPVDKLSQVNTLQQLYNITSYPFLQDKLRKNEVQLHAMWFDVYTGNFFVFSKDQNRFVEVDETAAERLAKEF